MNFCENHENGHILTLYFTLLLIYLNDFLICTFKPLLRKVWERSEKNWPSDNLEKDLPKSMQIFSPSDFGFHNAILKESGDLAFFDF